MKTDNNTLSQFNIVRFFPFFIMVFIVVCLSGCGSGSVVDSSMFINYDMSGKRVIDVHVEDEVFENQVSGTNDDIKKIISENIPNCMECDYTETSDIKDKTDKKKITYSFIINFDSEEDYVNKIKSILGDNISVEMEMPDNIWSSGIYLSESFTSRELMKWLQDAIVNEGLVSQGNAGYILGKGTNVVIFDNETFEVDEHIMVNTINKLQINDINILLDVVDIGNYSVDFVFEIPETTMKKRGTTIRNYMKSFSSDTVSVSEAGDNGVVFTISSQNRNIAELNELFKTVFGDERTSVSSIALNEQDYSTFSLQEYFNLKIDYGNYLGAENNTTHTKFLMKYGDEFQVANTTDTKDNQYFEAKDSDYTEYYLVYDGLLIKNDLNLFVCKNFDVNKINMIVNGKKDGSKWTRETSFCFLNDLLPTEEELLLNRFKNRIPDDTSKECADINIEIKNEDGKSETLVITESGDVPSIINSSKSLYGENSIIYYSTSKDLFEINKKFAYVDKIDFSSILPRTLSDMGIYYTFKINCNVKKCNVSHLNPIMDRKNFTVYTPGDKLDIELVGTYFDWSSFGTYLFIVTGILFILYALYFSTIFEKIDQMIARVYSGKNKTELSSDIITDDLAEAENKEIIDDLTHENDNLNKRENEKENEKEKSGEQI